MENPQIDLAWWNSLEAQWKDAFAITFFGHQKEPALRELIALYDAPALRFAGPRAPYPNMNFELTNLSGIAGLKNIEILVVVHNKISMIDEIRNLPRIKNLFLYDNKIENLDAIAEQVQIEQLYVQQNEIRSLLPLKKLVNLKELYVNQNNIETLEGLTEEHAEKLDKFFCKPNEWLKRTELVRVERDLGIKCREL